MKTYNDLQKLSLADSVLSIGNFDGVHLGHQSIIQNLSFAAKQAAVESVLITFQPHTRFFLQKDLKHHLICSLEQKMRIFEGFGIDHVLILPFNKEMAATKAKDFLEQVQKQIHFSKLFLGSTASLGSDRQSKTLDKIAEDLKFQMHRVESRLVGEQRISSSLARQMLQKGQFKNLEKILARPYSVLGKITNGNNRAQALGFPTANMSLNTLCLPPFGVYTVHVEHMNKTYHGIANLGMAPTFNKAREPLLEVHLIDFNQKIYGQELEVFFDQYIRPEQKFQSKDALIDQIFNDIEKARLIFKRKKRTTKLALSTL